MTTRRGWRSALGGSGGSRGPGRVGPGVVKGPGRCSAEGVGRRVGRGRSRMEPRTGRSRQAPHKEDKSREGSGKEAGPALDGGALDGGAVSASGMLSTAAPQILELSCCGLRCSPSATVLAAACGSLRAGAVAAAAAESIILLRCCTRTGLTRCCIRLCALCLLPCTHRPSVKAAWPVPTRTQLAGSEALSPATITAP